MPHLLGGGGRAAAPVPDGQGVSLTSTTAVWDLTTRKRMLYKLPSELGLIDYLGLTSTYLWVAGGPGGVQKNIITSYVRFLLQ
jgi:hypothetical protein